MAAAGGEGGVVGSAAGSSGDGMVGDGIEGGVTPGEQANGQSGCDEGNTSSSVEDTQRDTEDSSISN